MFYVLTSRQFVYRFANRLGTGRGTELQGSGQADKCVELIRQALCVLG
jgi:hypothetical protein